MVQLLSAAEFLTRPPIEPSAPDPPAADADGRFADYLDEARSSDAGAPADHEETEDTDTEVASEPEVETGDSGEASPESVIVPAELAKLVVPVGQPVEVDPSAAVGADQRSKGPSVQGGSGESATAPRAEAAKTDPQPILPQADGNPVRDGQPTNQPIVRETLGDASLQKVEVDRGSQAPTAGTDQTQSETVNRAPRQRESQERAVQIDQRPADKSQSEIPSERRAAENSNASRPAVESQARPDTARDRRVRRWLESRREGEPVTKDKPVRVEADGFLRRAALRSDVKRHVRPAAVSVKSGHGDGPASAITRFLVQSEGTPPPASDLGSVSTGNGATASRGVTPTVAATPADLVGELLSARNEGSDSVAQAARVLRASPASGRFQATLQLDPPELGQLKVHIRMHAQGMMLHVDTETQSAARLIESRLSELRDALANHGIRVDRADVVARPPTSAEAENQQTSQGQSSFADPGDGESDTADTRSRDAANDARQEPESSAEDGAARGDAPPEPASGDAATPAEPQLVEAAGVNLVA